MIVVRIDKPWKEIAPIPPSIESRDVVLQLQWVCDSYDQIDTDFQTHRKPLPRWPAFPSNLIPSTTTTTAAAWATTIPIPAKASHIRIRSKLGKGRAATEGRGPKRMARSWSCWTVQSDQHALWNNHRVLFACDLSTDDGDSGIRVPLAGPVTSSQQTHGHERPSICGVVDDMDPGVFGRRVCLPHQDGCALPKTVPGIGEDHL